MKDVKNLKFVFFFQLLLVDQEYFLILRNGRLFWETM